MFDGLESAHDREFFCYLMADVPGRPPGFDDWVRCLPESASARLLRGAHSIAWAWEARGSGPADSVEEKSWEIFFSRLREAERDLLSAAELDAADPTPWSLLLVSARGLQIPKEELRLRFDQADRRAKGLYRAHFHALLGLSGWWSGSDEEMIAFARAAAQMADDGSDIHAMVPVAHLQRWMASEKESQENYWAAADVRQEIVQHANRSVLHASWLDASRTVEALNVFAAVLFKCGEVASARLLIERIGARRSDYPWSRFSKPDQFFATVQRG